MAVITQQQMQFAQALQAACGLEDKDLRSLDVQLRLRSDEIVTMAFQAEEFVDGTTLNLISKVLQLAKWDAPDLEDEDNGR